MPVAVNRSESIGCTTPRLIFVHRAGGLLSDPVSLEYNIFDLSTGTAVEVLTNTAINLADCPTGQKLGLGRFAAVWAVPGGENVGAHEIRWRYVSTTGGNTVEARYQFEVLDDTLQAGIWEGVVTTDRLREEGVIGSTPTAAELLNSQRAIRRITLRIREFTGRRFEPFFATFSADGRMPASGAVRVPEAIVAVEKAELRDRADQTATTIDNDDLVIYNRHLDNMLQPDDRFDPRLEASFFLPPGLRAVTDTAVRAFLWPSGRQNIQVTGVYGYRDPDQHSPSGIVPRGIEDAGVMLTSREIQNVADPDALPDLLERYRRPLAVGIGG